MKIDITYARLMLTSILWLIITMFLFMLSIARDSPIQNYTEQIKWGFFIGFGYFGFMFLIGLVTVGDSEEPLLTIGRR